MIKTIDSYEITKAVSELCKTSNIYADPFIKECIKNAYENETEELPVYAAKMILDNMQIAKEEQMPLCQDTGMVVVFVDIGQDIHINGNLNEAINEGVRDAYLENYFRMSVVNCPLERKPTGDNTPAVIHYNIIEGDKLKISVMPKGFGSENKSALKMLKPSDGIEGIKAFVLETVKKAGRDPCPPIIVGIGIGGTMEKAALLAKQALLSEKQFLPLQKEILDAINNLKIGIAGLGGNLTALDVRILTYPTHIAGLPVAVNISCHVTRHASMEL